MNYKQPLDHIPALSEARLASLSQEMQEHILCLHTAFLAITDVNSRLTEEVNDLKARLAKDSTNSHKMRIKK